MEIDYDKDFKKVITELQTNFGWSNIEILPNSYKDLINDTIKAVKNCSIPVVVGQREQLPCDCNVKLAETTLQIYCPKCYKTHKMK